ncbi:flap endonuclease-1 [Candidatus Pacearchaeota archaeon]|nr:flap endonuclease-1 [Candidatus Pacearchaeota archaeon]
MGLQISDIIPKKEIALESLKGKTLAVDAFNVIYQFLSTIRQPDGTPLQDSKGRVTSHLSGLFYRNINLLQEGIKLVYVFDGKHPELKRATQEKRLEAKHLAQEKYEQAIDEEDVEAMGRYAKQLTHLDNDKIEESKKLLEAMGICVIQAPGEGEAQASYISRVEDEVYAIASQDYDCLLFETPRLIQNLTLAKKRKTSSGYVEITPQLITLRDVLKELEISQEQLICIGILCGTDYNPGGVKGIGPKKALKLVREYKTPAEIFQKITQFEKQDKYKIDFDWREIFQLMKNPSIDKDYKIEFKKFDFAKVKEIMLEHDFSEDRIESQFEKVREINEAKKQRTLF